MNEEQEAECDRTDDASRNRKLEVAERAAKGEHCLTSLQFRRSCPWLGTRPPEGVPAGYRRVVTSWNEQGVGLFSSSRCSPGSDAA